MRATNPVDRVTPEQLRRVLSRMLSEQEFLGPYGIRALVRDSSGQSLRPRRRRLAHHVDYEPGESDTGLFGGNSNWRGPVWMPVNFLMIEALQKFHHYLGDDFKVECPTGSGQMKTLWEVSQEVSRRLVSIFVADSQGRRPVFGAVEKFQRDPLWNEFPLFYEYIHGDTGRGVGASHQTGWTGLIAKLLQQLGEYGTEAASASPALAHPSVTPHR